MSLKNIIQYTNNPILISYDYIYLFVLEKFASNSFEILENIYLLHPPPITTETVIN